jgi:hypothetical protein
MHMYYVAATVHLKNDGVSVSMLLNIVKLACSHSGSNLAAVFTKILEYFGISERLL